MKLMKMQPNHVGCTSVRVGTTPASWQEPSIELIDMVSHSSGGWWLVVARLPFVQCILRTYILIRLNNSSKWPLNPPLIDKLIEITTICHPL